MQSASINDAQITLAEMFQKTLVCRQWADL